MKRILIALALIASVQVAGAQVKSVSDAKKALDAAIEVSQNAKKAGKAATWIKLGEAYVAAHDAPAGNVFANASRQELALVMGKEKPSSTENVVLAGENLVKEVYADKNLYFRDNGTLALVEPTNIIAPDALSKAAEAYKKAYSLDSKKAKDVNAALDLISGKLVNDAYSQYQLGDFNASSSLFEKAADVVANGPAARIDTNCIYNAAFTALAAGNNDRAKKFLSRCYDLGYYSADGELFPKLAQVDPDNAKKYLEEGFEKFPNSQSILIGLINYYLQNNEDPQKLFTLLDKAKENEPNNASLYYVEGNIHKQLGEEDAAIASYGKCAEIDPNYEFGHIGAGVLYYDKALALQEEAQKELDDAKYMALTADFEKALASAIDPFEKAYAASKDNGIKVTIAEYLKNIYYRFREQKPEYQAAYEKYNQIVNSGQAE